MANSSSPFSRPFGRLLVVEDDATTREEVVRALSREGHVVETAASGTAASELLKSQSWDALILDLGLPDGHGLDWCGEWRRRGHTLPILILTAAGDVGSRVEGLDAGADDYLAKPFALPELKARVRALLRRASKGAASRIFTVGDLHIDFIRRTALMGTLDIPVTPREFEVFERIVSAGGAVVLKDDLLEDFWGDATPENSASLDVIITRLRKKLDRGARDSLIRTLRGTGYALRTTSTP